jgi:hypothetical protein
MVISSSATTLAPGRGTPMRPAESPSRLPYSYDAAHSQHVSQLALNLFYQLQRLHKLPERYASILHAAACCTISACSLPAPSTTNIPTT